MIRTAFILLAAMGSFAAAAAFQEAPAAEARVAAAAANQTIVEKNSAFPVIGPVVFTECRTTDCAELPNQ